jgi:hypothetical protein
LAVVILLHPVIGGAPGTSPILAILDWTVFSGRIDNLLKGEVFTRTAGIYAAPKQAILLVVSRLGLSIFKTHAWQGGPVSFGALSLVAAWLQWQGVETDDG